MSYSTIRDEVQSFAARITNMGFSVWIAKSGTYGFISDASKKRVLSFSFDGFSLSGNYGPPSTNSGTGWRMDKTPESLIGAHAVHEALYAQPPEWCRDRGVGWRYLSTVDQYLAEYDKSSQFTQFVG